ncbi:hypothetical protein B9Z55_022566 [Caenorhabditis nigoni]|uniref:Uncharacterized protein n=1 Tax=Caenorhabditis nigoni TaxID=1611254 RepID=A0A2G5SLB8_9PELO|nr:hypothetical protein B9Z55_022566 [Caenorhabditis nigoni]
MSGDQNEVNSVPRSSTEQSEDDMEPVGTGPVVVLNQSRKMSIYGPNFKFGPLQLRRQRLLTKMKDEAEAAMAERTEQLKSEDEQQKKRQEEKMKRRKTSKKDKNDENVSEPGYCSAIASSLLVSWRPSEKKTFRRNSENDIIFGTKKPISMVFEMTSMFFL